MANQSDQVWWKQLYDNNLAEILLDNADPQEADKTLLFLKQQLNLQPGQRVLDQCCGTGRLSLALAKQHKVVGVDLIAEYVECAAQKAREQHLQLKLFCDDAFDFYLSPAADLVINWWTSFGYAENDERNIQMIKRAYESLKIGGSFALDFMNVPGLYRSFQTDMMTCVQRKQGKLVLVRHSEIDFNSDILKKDWYYFLENGQRIHHQSQVRLYSPAQLLSFFEMVGFAHVKLYGDLDGQSLSLSSPRCIVVGQRI
ncbi:class I SAM-dependent methyltransferase [Spartinivicinus poritis]|uniref:Class I SAM-dependent methyltransferase n=1 Tax=Spartinivicinus poritis TaxID=2994640 RepID=A0ABT5UF73_9GAMM|nr:class I SAM-dependent methyltransferase [Spartinivicinus sp. A2-2]MDE1463739.1 class I SAM-dependent methyltransferase [Spartinivicinus sp. A2-2]